MKKAIIIMAGLLLAFAVSAAEKGTSKQEKATSKQETSASKIENFATAKAEYINALHDVGVLKKTLGPALAGTSTLEKVDTAEKAFMAACKKCAPLPACEADRLTIRHGEASLNYNLCDQ